MDKSRSSSTKGNDSCSNTRHCAYCLVELTQAKRCGKCGRRAYCSKECQSLDWTVGRKDKAKGGVGQGHKHWCGVPYGEEDLDWKVVPIEGKGLGIRALRDIPSLYRIIVEGWLTLEDAEGNPRVSELTPEGMSNRKKFMQNSGTGETGPTLGLRFSRVNHACGGNASVAADIDLKVLILHSNQEIKAGEEICFSYIPFFTDIAKQLQLGRCPPNPHRSLLNRKWNIDCPETCICYDTELQTIIDECFAIHNNKYQPACALGHTEDVVQALEEIMELMLTAKSTSGPVAMENIWIRICGDAKDQPNYEMLDKYGGMIFNFRIKVYHPSLNKATKVFAMHSRGGDFLLGLNSLYHYLKPSGLEN